MIPCPRGCPFKVPRTPYAAKAMRVHVKDHHGAPRAPSAGRRVRCPSCKAAVGAACINPRGLRIERTHKPRLIASKARAAAMSYAAPRGTPRSVSP